MSYADELQVRRDRLAKELEDATEAFRLGNREPKLGTRRADKLAGAVAFARERLQRHDRYA